MQGRSASASSLSVCHAKSLWHACICTSAQTEVNAYPGDHLPVTVLLRILLLPQIAALSSNTDTLLKHHFEGQNQVLLLRDLIVRFGRLYTQSFCPVSLALVVNSYQRSYDLQVILNTLKSERGECSLEHLQQSTDEEIKAELERFKGVGKKTIACVLMFCLDRHEFPVDTHVWRITKAMGWVPSKASRDEAYSHLNARIPDHLK